MVKNAIGEALLQGLGTSQMVTALHPRSNEARERLIDFGGYALELLYSMGFITLADCKSPETPGEDEAMAKIGPLLTADPRVLYLTSLAASVKAVHYFGVESFEVHNFSLAMRAVEACLAALEAIPFLSDEDARIRHLKDVYPEVAPLYDHIFSPEFSAQLVRQMYS